MEPEQKAALLAKYHFMFLSSLLGLFYLVVHLQLIIIKNFK